MIHFSVCKSSKR